jgi:hypothetical protein
LTWNRHLAPRISRADSRLEQRKQKLTKEEETRQKKTKTAFNERKENELNSCSP